MEHKNFLQRLKGFNWFRLKDLGILGVLGFFGPPQLRLFFLFYLIGIVEWIVRSNKEEKKLKQEEPAIDLRRYYITLLYAQINPFTILLSLQQLLGQLFIRASYQKGLPAAENYRNKCEYSLPFRGRWTAVNGGSSIENSHSWEIFTQRYAYDFVIHDTEGRSYKNDGKKLSDYYCFGQDILSPADGVVVKVNDKIRDYDVVGDYSLDWKTTDFRGNFVIIRHAENEYSFLAHLKKDSICVKKGEKVKMGQKLGSCGNSGHSTEPHLHFHLQDSANFWLAAGLPVRFKELIWKRTGENESLKINAFVEKGEIVWNMHN